MPARSYGLSCVIIDSALHREVHQCHNGEGSLEWVVASTTVTHSSVDWWDILLPLAWTPDKRDRRLLVSPPKDTCKVGKTEWTKFRSEVAAAGFEPGQDHHA